MRIDSVYSGPSRPHAVRDFVAGRAQIDKRLRLGNALQAASGNVAQAWDDWADGAPRNTDARHPRGPGKLRGRDNHQHQALSARSWTSSRPHSQYDANSYIYGESEDGEYFRTGIYENR